MLSLFVSILVALIATGEAYTGWQFPLLSDTSSIAQSTGVPLTGATATVSIPGLLGGTSAFNPGVGYVARVQVSTYSPSTSYFILTVNSPFNLTFKELRLSVTLQTGATTGGIGVRSSLDGFTLDLDQQAFSSAAAHTETLDISGAASGPSVVFHVILYATNPDVTISALELHVADPCDQQTVAGGTLPSAFDGYTSELLCGAGYTHDGVADPVCRDSVFTPPLPTCDACEVANCTQYFSGCVCDACASGYILDFDTNVCRLCTDARVHCTSCGGAHQDVCTACAAGYYLEDNHCFACNTCPGESIVQACTNTTNTVCLSQLCNATDCNGVGTPAGIRPQCGCACFTNYTGPGCGSVCRTCAGPALLEVSRCNSTHDRVCGINACNTAFGGCDASHGVCTPNGDNTRKCSCQPGYAVTGIGSTTCQPIESSSSALASSSSSAPEVSSAEGSSSAAASSSAPAGQATSEGRRTAPTAIVLALAAVLAHLL